MELAAATSTKDAKQALRREMRGRRDALSSVECAEAGRLAARLLGSILDGAAGNRFPVRPERPVRVAAVYASLPGEIDTGPVALALSSRGVRLAWPRVVGDHLDLHFADRSDLRPAGRFRIDEPPADAPLATADELDLVVVPGLAFDESGGRLGFGRGYYDRLLAAASGALRVAPCLSSQIASAVPVEPHDQRVDVLLIASPDHPHILPARAARTRVPAAAPAKEIH